MQMMRIAEGLLDYALDKSGIKACKGYTRYIHTEYIRTERVKEHQ